MTRWLTLLAAAFLAAGGALMLPSELALQHTTDIAAARSCVEAEVTRSAALEADRLAAETELAGLNAELRDKEAEIAALGRLSGDASAAWDSVRAEVQGPGLRAVLDDARSVIVHDVNLLYVVSALRNGGASAIAVNGARVVESSFIKCGGPTIWLGRVALAPPFIVEAVGDPDKLYAALMEDGDAPGRVLLKSGVLARPEKMDSLTIGPEKGVNPKWPWR